MLLPESLVSVIIPLYNQKEYVKRAIESVLKQTYSPIEIIVINDGSTDNPHEVLDKYFGKVKVIDQKNQGLAATRNIGLKNCLGEYIQFLDADDTILKDKIAKQVKILEKNKDCSLTACRAVWVDEEGKTLSVQKKYLNKFPTIKEFLMENQFPVHSVLMKKAILLKTGLFDEKMNSYEDLDLWIRILLNGYKIICTNHVLVKYFQISNAMSSNADIMYNARMKILKKYFTVFPFKDNFREKVYSNAYLQSSGLMYRGKKIEKARELILKAIKLNPLILNDFYFYYDFKQFYKPINLNRKCTLNEILSSQKELLTILKQVKKMNSPFVKQLLARAYSHYYFSLALSHLLLGDFRKFLFFSKCSLKNNFSYFTYMIEIIIERIKGKIQE